MTTATQPISIVPTGRTQSQDTLHWSPVRSPSAMSTASTSSQNNLGLSGEGSTSWSIHPGPLFVSGSLSSVAGMSLSFGSKLYPSCSAAGQLLNPLDPTDFKCRVSSSIESDHSSLINARMSEREMEPYRNFSCCGYPLTDMHALADHYETHHVYIVDPATGNPVQQQQQHSGQQPTQPALGADSPTTPMHVAQSSLAGALGPAHSVPGSNMPSPSAVAASNADTASLHAGGIDIDDMDLEYPDVDNSAASSPSTSSSHSSPGAGPGGCYAPLPSSSSTNAYGFSNMGIAGTLSAVSSPPDTPLLSTPVSPVNSGGFGTPFTSWAQDFGNGSTSNGNSSNGAMTPQPLGPPAFDSVHVPAKGAFHPYAGARKTPLHHFSSMYALRSGGFSLNSANGAGSGSPGNAANRTGAMNAYAGYSDYSSAFPGGLSTAGATAALGALGSEMSDAQEEGGIQPGLLFSAAPASVKKEKKSSSSVAQSSRTTPAQSRAGSPSASGGARLHKSASIGGGSGSGSSSSALGASTTLSRPAAALLLSKPFKCPTPGCMKSYKQANGLKYHVTHGQCSFTPPPELCSVEGLTEREAERRLRPYCCQVPPCTRRYKNMNGLRYHYQHSGDHGARGLALLQSGNHDPLKSHDFDEDELAALAMANAMETDGSSNREGTRSAPTTPVARQNQRGKTLAQQQQQAAAQAQLQAHHQQQAQFQAQQQAQYQQMAAAYVNASMTPTPTPTSASSMAAFQSQPASAYASPWGSPRSGSPTAMNATPTQSAVSKMDTTDTNADLELVRARALALAQAAPTGVTLVRTPMTTARYAPGPWAGVVDVAMSTS